LTKEELNIIFDQAKNDEEAVSLSKKEYQSYIYKGVKIVNDFESIKLYKPLKDYDLELSEDHYTFFKKGWRHGIYKFKIIQYDKKLDDIQDSIRYEMNNNMSLKEIKRLRVRKENILKKRSNITFKLNQLK
tara:strand:- start:7 stop:399 length:393 start_codon:yes stop_codon:yes gene_type:complete